MKFCGVLEHQQPMPLSMATGDKASPDTVLDDVPLQNQQMLPQEGRGKDYNNLLEGGGNGCVVDSLPSTSRYPDIPQDLIEAILMDDGDEEDQTPMNFSSVQENQLPTPLSAAAGDKTSPDTVVDDVPLQNQQMLPQEGRGDDYNDLLEGGGNGCIVDPLPSTSPYPNVPWDLLAAILMGNRDEEDQMPMNFSGVLEHHQLTALSVAAGDKVLPGLVFDDIPLQNQQMLPQEGRGEDYNDLLEGGGNRCVVDLLPSTTRYPDVLQDLIEAILMDDRDEEDQKAMNFSSLLEHQHPMPLSAATSDKASHRLVSDDVPLQNRQMLPQEGRGEDYNDLLEGGGNGCVIDPLQPMSPYPDVPQDLIEAILMDDGDEEDQMPMNFYGVQEHEQPTLLSTTVGDKASPDRVFDNVPPQNQQLLPLEGRVEDHNDLLKGGGNGCVVDALLSTSPYPDVPWDLIAAILIDDRDEEDQTPIKFSGISEHHQPTVDACIFKKCGGIVPPVHILLHR